jgi:hypothetical protein
MANPAAGFVINFGTAQHTMRCVTTTDVISTLDSLFTSTDAYWNTVYAGGAGGSTGFGEAWSLANDGNGNVYVGTNAPWCALWAFNPACVVTRIAGTGVVGYSGDGGPAIVAEVNVCQYVCTDPAGNVYFVDLQSPTTTFQGAVIRVVNMQSTTQTIHGVSVAPGNIAVVAGNGSSLGGYSGDAGPATSAELCYPLGLAHDSLGNLYIADGTRTSGSGYYRIRQVNSSGTITTVAGSGTRGYSGDGGPATSAELYNLGCAVDAAGNLYIADTNNNRIRAVNMQSTTQTILNVSIAAGDIQTVAGTGGGGHSGNGGQATSAQIGGPIAVIVDSAGNVYLSMNYYARMITPAGIINDIAGTGTDGYTGDGGPATSAEIHILEPGGMAFFTYVPATTTPPTEPPPPAYGDTLSERRFACNGCFESSSAYGDVLKSLALSMAGFVVPPGDCWRIYAGSYVPPSVILEDADCRSAIKGDFRLSARDTCNGVKGQYIPAFLPINPLGPLAASPASPAWKKTDFPPVQRANYIAEDGGVILWKDIQLDFTISLWMAQRIARIVLERLRRQVTISLPAKLTGIALLAADTMQFIHPRWASVTPPVPEIFQVSHTALRMESQADGVPAFGTDLVLRETDADVYEFQEPSSPTDFGDYSPYGQTGIGAGNVE